MKHPPIGAVMLLLSSTLFAQSNDSAQVYFQKALSFKDNRQYLQAAKHFEKSLSFNDKFTPAWMENAKVNMEMRRTDLAISSYSKVLEIEPDNSVAAAALMEMYFNYRLYDKAAALAYKCSKLPLSEKIIGMCAYQQEDYGKAIKGLTSYTGKFPTDAEAMYTLARCYLDMEQYAAAVPFYNKAVLLNAEKINWIYELGLLYYTLNDFKNAVAYFNQAADKGYPKKSDFVENLGYAYIYSGRFDEGEQMLNGLLEKRPGDKQMIRDLAEAMYKNKQYDRSLGYCQKLMEMDAKDGKALYQAGLCFQKKGDKDKGQAMCDQAIELDPSLNSLRQKKGDFGL
jgi:tetratricopeptide (TPR) repeat protein